MAKKKKIKNKFKVLAFVEVHEVSQGWRIGGESIPGTFDRTPYTPGYTNVLFTVPYKQSPFTINPFTPDFLNLINYGPQWREDGTEFNSVRFTFTDINDGATITIVYLPGNKILQSTKSQTFSCVYA